MRAVMLVMAGIVVAGTVAGTGAAVEPPEDSRVLTDRELRAEMGTNERLGEYIERNGWPDVAERQFLGDADPWDDYQVTLYYLDDRKQLSFARAWVLGEPSIHLEKSDQALSEDEVDRLRPLARPYGVGGGTGGGSAVERAEAAALRAEDAAARVDAAAATVERAAERAETVVARMASGTRRSRRR